MEAKFLAGSELMHDASVDRLLAGLIGRVRAANSGVGLPEVRCYVLDRDLPYAFFLDNGALFISTGLLARVQDESGLAGLVVPEIAEQVHHNEESANDVLHKRNVNHILPNLLLITATAGLAGFPINKSDQKAADAVHAKLQLESDTLALGWLRRAGYDVQAAPRAAQHLLDALAAEHHYGTNTLSDAASLADRRQALERALAALPGEQGADPPVAPAAQPDDLFVRVLEQSSYLLAYRYVEAEYPERFNAAVDRLEARFGPSMKVDCLRAHNRKHSLLDDTQLDDVIAGYEKCVAHREAMPAAQRELGFLYRRKGDAQRARQHFQAYLDASPGAPDVLIVKGYMESL